MKRYNEDIKEAARKLRAEGKSYPKIAKELGASDESVRFWCNPSLVEKRKDYIKQNSTHLNAYNREYYRKNRESENERSKKYFSNNRESVNKQRMKYHKARYARDINYRIMFLFRGRLRDVLKIQGSTKNKRSMDLLGCSVDFFKAYLESKFLEGMTWDNYGRGGWVMDHIIPCASFDLTIEENQKKCFHYTNIQPLWEIDNIRKGSKIINPT